LTPLAGHLESVARRSSVAVAATSTVAVGLVGAAPALADGLPAVSVDASASNLAYALPTSPVIAAAPEAVNTDLQEVVPEFKAPAPVAAPKTKAPKSASSTTRAPLPDSVAGDILAIAEYYKGIPYVYGGTSTSGIDCSGYVQFVFSKAGISLPHSSKKMRDTLPHISASEARPGDLVFMYTSNSGSGCHIGIYAGGNQMWDASYDGTGLHTIRTPNVIFLRPPSP
jgi:cell wall-associated NlpC family hydrolase